MRQVLSPVLGFMGAFHHGALQQKGLMGLIRCGIATSSNLTEDDGLAPETRSLALDHKPNGPVLLQLPDRSWGAPPHLPRSTIEAIIGPHAAAASRLGVLRSPFTAFHETPRSFAQTVRPLGGAAVAVATEASQPHGRIVVDEYVATSSGSYDLREVATDLSRYLNNEGVRIALVPDVSKAEGSTAAKGAKLALKQSSNEVLMVAPTAFGFNEQAAEDNSFMHVAPKPGPGSRNLTHQVLYEFAELHHQLREVAGVKVHLFEHSLAHSTPDACFPNNWFSTHPAGEASGGVDKSTLVLYPMKHPNRAAERRADMIYALKLRGYERLIDYSDYEAKGLHFEGTGALVLDRINGVAYVDVSERADVALAEKWAAELGYKDLVTFRSTDLRGKSVYHTNVMMAIGSGVAIVCAESVKDASERHRLLSSLSRTHEVVEISLEQMDSLCGNALELQDVRGVPVMAMSTQAYNAFTEQQREAILRHVSAIVHSPIDTLENVGGGGVRCTLGELF
ncbi:Amidinotransferase-domain-containing protein [Dunaliella salina]|uniref:Amidinotransferase-domain-containing protein n=1 Tax=Dunaliella salina TaxID=3046 RepID=A0ABQ7GMP3_DUNSA|nr:Amidinotransferase-domain-containing protein [Dunaliella salina]|eukprot:KAF5835837.1 Amidinotransferase-domain-containing protein [Dunaliella salina]